jgi:hypothetical protein
MKKLKIFEEYKNKLTEYDTCLVTGKIPDVDFEDFHLGIPTKKLTKLTYFTFIRYYLFMRLLNFKGGDYYLKNIIGIVSSNKKEEDKGYAEYSYYCEILNKIGNNETVRKNTNNTFFVENFIKTNYDNNIKRLSELYKKRNVIFGNYNLHEIVQTLENCTKVGKKAEIAVKKFLDNSWGDSYIFLSGSTRNEDQSGIDLKMINRKSNRQSILQVKYISQYLKLTIEDTLYNEEKRYIIKIPKCSLGFKTFLLKNNLERMINDKDIDIKEYYPSKLPTTKLGFDHLILLDDTKSKLYFIKGGSIISIDTSINGDVVILMSNVPSLNTLMIYKL